MVKAFRFGGPDVQLGEFGLVKAGDLLVLTPKEADGVQDDNRFRSVKDDEVPIDQIENAELRESNQISKTELREEAERLGIEIPGWRGKQEILARIQTARRELAAKQKAESAAAAAAKVKPKK